jgi:hypothetical protein
MARLWRLDVDGGDMLDSVARRLCRMLPVDGTSGLVVHACVLEQAMVEVLAHNEAKRIRLSAEFQWILT